MKISRMTGAVAGLCKYLLASLIALLILFPIYVMTANSLKPNNQVFDLRIFPRTLSLEGFQYVIKEDFSRFFFNSFFISVTVTVVSLIFHSMSGYVLARINFPGRRVVFLWILSTLMIPFAVIMIPLFIMIKQFGWLNSYAGVIIPAIPHAYGIFLFRQFFLTVPGELEDAALIDGCSLFQIYYRVIVPLSKPITMMLAVAFFIANWNSYLWPLIVTTTGACGCCRWRLPVLWGGTIHGGMPCWRPVCLPPFLQS
ncbi:MAG: carbohydrate ABC transporter permease [Treponema sp.]|jgi:multiple sugar transport system permease protein|nr:carbohydrate ABC transporter permease [Treponema sp.]